MTVSFHTTVAYSTANADGLPPGEFIVWHNCMVCRDVVATDRPVDHARRPRCTAFDHGPAGAA